MKHSAPGNAGAETEAATVAVDMEEVMFQWFDVVYEGDRKTVTTTDDDGRVMAKKVTNADGSSVLTTYAEDGSETVVRTPSAAGLAREGGATMPDDRNVSPSAVQRALRATRRPPRWRTFGP